MKKFFIVGCSRSGTSIVQKHIVANKDIYSLPETAFFSIGNETKEKRIKNLYRTLDYTSSFDRSSLYKKNIEQLVSALELIKINTQEFIEHGIGEYNTFESILNYAAKSNGYEYWVEKTPLHFIRSKEILRNYPNAEIIFVLRNGLDVCASIRDRAIKYDEFSHQHNINFSINLWNNSISIADKMKDNPRFHILDFNKFTESPDTILHDILPDVPKRLKETPVNITNSNEKWKENINGKIQKQPSKVENLLSKEEIQYAKSKLNFEIYNTLAFKK